MEVPIPVARNSMASKSLAQGKKCSFPWNVTTYTSIYCRITGNLFCTCAFLQISVQLLFIQYFFLLHGFQGISVSIIDLLDRHMMNSDTVSIGKQ